jgi:prepilin-type N-terminal cleavage/methylation domain-containing protein
MKPANFQVATVIRRAKRAFSLIEVLVAVTLMSVIILGLMAMFSETQRAFRLGITQVDVLEPGRSALELMAREVEQAAPTHLGTNSFNFYVGGYNNYPPNYPLIQPLPGSTQARTNIFQNFVFTTRENQNWKAIGYAVIFTNNYVGTLYRYETNATAIDPTSVSALLRNVFLSPSNHVVDGVVDFRVHAYDTHGRLISPAIDYLSSFPFLHPEMFRVAWSGIPDDVWCEFLADAVPAYLEIELGLLEARVAEKAQAAGELSLQAQFNYLTTQVGRVHVFRQRIPIRNVDTSVYR